MAFTNLPANLQDMFYGLSDRVAKLETGPNQAAYTADTAQSTASSAASAAANAQTQAVQAQAAATIASTQATQAQTSADGKNKVYYSTSTPGSTANQAGDIWYQYGTSGTYANKVIAQWSGAGGTSWTSVTVSGLVIANIDAGAITTGTLSAIEISAGSGGSQFHVSPSGYMSAQGVYIQGTITADTGIFRGSLYSSLGTIAGWQLNNDSFSNNAADTFLYANPGSDGLFISSIGRGIMRRLQLNGSSGTTLGSNTLAVGGTASIDSDATIAGNIRSVGTASTTTSSTANMYINSSSGLMARSTASSQRYKHDIANLTDVPELDPKALYELPVRAFRFNQDYLPETDDRSDVLVPGFIAEEVDAIYPAAVDYSNGQVETWNDRMLVPGLLALIQDLNNRVKELEAKLSNP